jgi:hypothetical protein
MNVSFLTWLKKDLNSFTLTPTRLRNFALAWTWMRDFTLNLHGVKISSLFTIIGSACLKRNISVYINYIFK